ncbi:hypothetical protein R2R35_14135 [Anaerocolumna sp. AGMB13020]|uniref:hypothetical protein n=1 Tax=Anaerocolumna sp. AGMB13020 TaxID=3081750 RepID=UPI00295384E7|nr:hypothetical protein [Anaerocolumna sp. AGMB13020]WOO34936.1 hypothetical protein R2R35_14135 [Anaerocolumna sp. AGMB13020]
MNANKTPSSKIKNSKDIFDVKELDKKHYCDSKTLALIFGLSTRWIQQLTKDGILEMVDTEHGKKYDLFPTILHFAKYQSEKLKKKGGSKREEDLKMLKLEAEIALKESQGELHRYKSDIQYGKYIDVADIQRDYERFFDIFKKFALSLPSKVSNKLNGFLEPLQIRHIEKELKDEVAKQLTGFVIAATVDQEE